jgi:peptidyl-tRNA hydrolase
MRKDLNMTPAKLAVQVGHGTGILGFNLDRTKFEDWYLNHEMKKIVLEIGTEEKLINLYDKLDESGACPCYPIIDNGHTEFFSLTRTGMVVFVEHENYLPKALKRLRLYS